MVEETNAGKKPADTKPGGKAKAREDRLKQKLRQNLGRRKQQQRARADQTPKTEQGSGES